MLYAVVERECKRIYKRASKLVVDITPVQDGVLKVDYRSGTVNSKSFIGKVFLRIKWKFELINDAL